MEVIQQDNLIVTKIPNSFKNSNTFIIAPEGCDDVWLVDIGDSEPVLSATGDKRIEGIFLTHAHFDHIYGIKGIIDRFPDCIVYGSALCLEYLHNDKKNLSYYYQRPMALDIENRRMLLNGSAIKLIDDINIECFYTPGHSPDSACYQIENMIFTGDAYIPGIPTVTKLRGGNKSLSAISIDLIRSKINPATKILPGHGNVAYNLT